MKYLFGYFPLLVISVFIYLPGLIALCFSFFSPKLEGVIGQDQYLPTFLEVRCFFLKYRLSFSDIGFACLSAGLILVFIGLMALEMKQSR